MFNGRILVVSAQPEIAADLDPIIRAEGHLALAVASSDEALEVFEEGIIPDVVISDSPREAQPGSDRFLRRFRQLNQLGRHIRVVEQEHGAAPDGEAFTTLQRPFCQDQVRTSLREAMDEIRRDLQSLRGEMFRETARLQRAIREAQLEMVSALAITMETKDPYMRGHCARVAELAAAVAQELGVEEEATERLRTAALLHELGKIAVPLSLLHKTEALSAEELEQIRAHPQAGTQIVTAIPSLRHLAPLIASQYTEHAELSEQIGAGHEDLLLAGILRVADSYDAMTSSRSYRNVLPRESWIAVLRSGQGRRFHPAAVDAFFRMEARRPA